jgi:hypothetical protein
MLQHMVLEMADVKSILDSTELGAMTPNIVRPGFEGTSTWEEILGILEDDSASAFGMLCIQPETDSGEQVNGSD